MSIPALRALLVQQIAMDIGTANTLIYVPNRGIVLNQPSVICFQRPHGDRVNASIETVGDKAKALLGRIPRHLDVVQPIQRGVVVDVSAAEQMIHRFIKISRVSPWVGHRMAVTLCIPSAATPVERRALCEAVMAAGAVKVHLINVGLCAALGAGLPVTEAIGSLLVDIGAGTSSVVVTALGSAIHQASIQIGGAQLDAAIINHVRNLYGVQLGKHTAEHVKQRVGTSYRGRVCQSISVVGHHLADGAPRTIELTSEVITAALAAPLNQIMHSVKYVLEKSPPELVTDIANRGIVLTGGSALLAGLPQRLHDETGLTVRVADHPLTCAVRGAGYAASCLRA
ncbi:rod shape-determining protein MreB [Burkholderia territorii]|uniref:Cell shape-determining protein MreB n=1 Tax=Burkholderia territorii TaxID=1503055 RepID=A0A108ETD9_9BURK|nr:rod shape-determining protein [Burkholderia territorii]KWN16835.1 rod shape-determining protein MreB [Burkholderia territorii]